MATTLENVIEAGFSELLALLRDLIDINSFSTVKSGNDAVVARLAEEYRLLSMETSLISQKECGDFLVTRTKATGTKRVLLMGHVDTVHSPESPFSKSRMDGDKLYGPGAYDMKGGNIVILGALRAMHRIGTLQSVPLTVFHNTDEEIGSPFSRKVLSEVCREAKEALVFEFGRAGDDVITARRGICDFKLSVTGVPAHSGINHQKGVNAIRELCSIVEFIEGLTDYGRALTTNVGQISGGTATNVIAENATANFEIRFRDEADFEKVKNAISQRCKNPSIVNAKAEIQELCYSAPMPETPAALELFHRYSKAGAKAGMSGKPLQLIMGGVSDANNIAQLGIPVIDGLGPLGDGAHTNEEWCSVKSLKQKITALAFFLTDELNR